LPLYFLSHTSFLVSFVCPFPIILPPHPPFLGGVLLCISGTRLWLLAVTDIYCLVVTELHSSITPSSCTVVEHNSSGL
jgi:hypothetical protein